MTSQPSAPTRTRRAWLEAPRRLALTRPGKFFLLMTLGVGFGAINTGNNLLFLLLGMMLSLIIASGLLSEAVLRHVLPARRLPRNLEARQPAPGSFRVENRGSWPALSLEVAEQNTRAVAGPLAGQTVGPRHVPWYTFWRGSEATPKSASAYCLRANAEAEESLPTHYRLPARGRYELPGLEVSTRFPFGLFDKSRRFDAPEEITVLPQIFPADLWLSRLELHWGDVSTNKRGPGEEFFGLRDYRAGEDQRQIHWKSSARRGEPVVRETEALHQRALAVLFDHRGPTDSKRDILRFERGLSHLCGLLQTLQRRGIHTHLITCHDAFDLGGGLTAAMHHLATIEFATIDTPPPSLPEGLRDRVGPIHVGFDELLPPATPGSLRLTFNELADSADSADPTHPEEP